MRRRRSFKRLNYYIIAIILLLLALSNYQAHQPRERFRKQLASLPLPSLDRLNSWVIQALILPMPWGLPDMMSRCSLHTNPIQTQFSLRACHNGSLAQRCLMI